MKTIRLVLTISFTFAISASFSQFKPSNAGGYTMSIQVDSSHFYIIGGQPNKAEKTKYVTEDRSQGYTSYSGDATLWTNVYVYNDSTEKLLKVFDLPLAGVYPSFNTMQALKYDYFYQDRIASGVSKDNLIFVVKTDSYNNDGVIDSDDPVYLFVSKKDGTGCKQISPNGMNVTGWKLIKGGAGIILTMQPDKNADKKFTEDEELYQVSLDADISKVRITPIVAGK